MEKFKPQDIEAELYQQWESADYFAPSGNGDPYCILIPPPNVTGSLHMGHTFQHTLMDTLIRYQRMQGGKVLWQMGTDHAGIATQMLVERQLAESQQTRYDLGREKFLERVWAWKNESGNNISQQIRRVGSSLDWSRDRFTMDPGYAKAVTEVFVRLHDEGLIYRGKRLVNWDPVLRTAISDLEVENTEENGHLWHFKYPLLDGAKTANGETHLTVATTRPETMLGDSAVAVHPDDERYAHLIGSHVQLPLVDRPIPVIADHYVDREFGTGCVKITPAHDFNDNEVGARHDLPLINIFTDTAALNETVPEAYRGLDRGLARTTIVADMDNLGLLAKIDDHKLMVPRGDRSGAVIEPYLTDQWFVKIAPLAEPAIAAVENGDIQFVPKQYENTYFAWMREIKDWCISRQLWWGHRIPAFYDDAGKIYVAATEAEARRKYDLSDDVTLRQDDDVLETWFSSALWPFATLGWPDETATLEDFLPSSVLVTGHDIIFFWVARMIMMTQHFTGKVPFKTVYIHGLVRDAEGQKMSKTKGNGLDPLDFIDGIELDALVTKRTSNLTQPKMAKRIEQATRRDFPDGIPAYGCDALRFTFCALATTGRDVRFDLNRIEGYRNFCNKLWNAANFVFMNTEDLDIAKAQSAAPSIIDRWVNSQMHRLIQDSELALKTYRFDLYASSVYEFAWGEYCDWYLEFCKPLFWREDTDAETENAKNAAKLNLLRVLEALLRAAHPIIPFITETLWQTLRERLNISGETIMLQAFPQTDEFTLDAQAEAQVNWLKAIITGVRTIRGEANIKPSQAVNLLLQGGNQEDRERAERDKDVLQRLANVGDINWLAAVETAPPNALALVGDLKVMVPLAGLIDVAAERQRLDKELEKLTKELKRIQGKLGNESFVAKAPAEVVAKEQHKAADIETALGTLNEQVAQLAELG